MEGWAFWQHFTIFPTASTPTIRTGWQRSSRNEKFQLDPAHNPFFEHAQAAFWLAMDEPVGRITAQIDALHQTRRHDDIGRFGIAFYRIVGAEPSHFPKIGSTADEFGVKRGVESMVQYFTEAMGRGEIQRANVYIAAEQFLDLSAEHLHRRRLWEVIAAVTHEKIDN